MEHLRNGRNGSRPIQHNMEHLRNGRNGTRPIQRDMEHLRNGRNGTRPIQRNMEHLRNGRNGSRPIQRDMEHLRNGRNGTRPIQYTYKTSSSKSAVSRLPTRTTAKAALAAPVHGPTLRGPASNGGRRRPHEEIGGRCPTPPALVATTRFRTQPDRPSP